MAPRVTNHLILERLDEIMSQFNSLKDVLDKIGGHLAGISSGVKSMSANLAALKGNTTLSAGDAALLDGALSEAQDLESKFGALEQVFSDNGASIPSTSSSASSAAAAAADPAPATETKAADPAPANQDSAAAASSTK